MKVEWRKPVEYAVSYIDVEIPVEQDDIEEGCIDADCFGLSGGKLRLRLDVDNKCVVDWPEGEVATIHLKARDEGTYRVISHEGKILREDDGYVPSFVPGEYGDYFSCRIDAKGNVLQYNGNKWRPQSDDIQEWLEQED